MALQWHINECDCILHDSMRLTTNKNCPEEKQTLDFKMTSLQPK